MELEIVDTESAYRCLLDAPDAEAVFDLLAGHVAKAGA